MISLNAFPTGTLKTVFLAGFLVVFCLGCSDDSTAPEQGSTVLDDTGTVLKGDPGIPALEATVDFGPIPAEPADIVDGFFTTRLSAILGPDATVGQVNEVLGTNDLLIVSMGLADPFLTLETPAMANATAGQDLADALTATGAFLYVHIDFAPAHPTDKIHGAAKILPPSGQPGTEHLELMRVLPAWNARRAMDPASSRVDAYVPDFFASASPHPQISGQDFLTATGTGDVYGNDGFVSAGIIAADFDDVVPTGIHPGAPSAITTYCRPIGGLTWDDVIRVSMPRNLPNVSVVPITLEYTVSTEFQSVIDAMRVRLLNIEPEHLICAFAGKGNSGLVSPWTSPWALAASPVEDLTTLLVREDLTQLQRAILDNMAELLDRVAGLQVPDNILIVGASDYEGDNVTQPNAMVRAPFAATGPCVIDDGECDGSVAFVEESWVAVPQVAGVAAYLWSLRGDLTAPELIQILRHAFDTSANPGFVDAYAAVLALDSSLATATVRRAILDVTDFSGVIGIADGRFDEHDIQAFLDARSPVQTHSRLDLNGDGRTGSSRTRMDLNVDLVPSYETAAQAGDNGCDMYFDETAVSDLDALIYYAYSPLFTGDPNERARLLDSYLPGECQSEEEIIIDWAGSAYDYDYGECTTPCNAHPHTARTIQKGTTLTFVFGERHHNSTCAEYPDGKIIVTTTVPESWSGFSGEGVIPDFNCEVPDYATGLQVSATLSGSTLTGTIDYQNNCDGGCWWEFILERQ